MKAFQAIVSTLVAPSASESVLATLATVEGSSYRRPGARVLLTADGQRLGSISGGCLEEDVLVRARRVLSTGLASPAATTQRPPSKRKIAVEFGAEQVAQAKPTNADDELRTTIAGTVQEFSGRAVFVLGNGQIWQLRTPTDVILPKKLVNPAVTLIRGAFGYKLVIDDDDLILLVKRVQ